MRRLAVGVLAGLVIVSAPAAGRSSRAQTADPAARLNAAIDPVINALWSSFDERAAMGHVQFISQYWRLPGNSGYDKSLDRVAERVKTSGVFSGSLAEEKTPDVVRAWDFTTSTLAIVRDGQPDDVVLSREKEKLALCINSFSTAPGGVVAPLVDVGRGDRDQDYAGKDLKGAVVLGDADTGQLWRRAVVTGGAIGVVSGALPAYLNADAPTAKPTPRDEWDILQWSSVPYDEARKGFGFKASPRAVTRLRAALRANAHATVRVTIASTFTMNPVRTLVAEIPGRVAPNERIVIAAHVQEPGANDNASGVATLAEMVVALASGIKEGRIPAPGRTLTFLFLTEISGSRQWLQSHPADAKNVKYMFSMDMTGEDIAKTGGSFLIERYPDPGAVWERPWDPHSEWGKGNVGANSLKGDLLNDVHLAICRRVAAKTGWVVKTNPYEGGSDHTVFGSAGVPSLLNWHFTDRYYHTNFDTPDKTSPAEMKNVGVAVASSAWFLASASEAQAIDAAEVVAAAGRARVGTEETEGAKLALTDKDPAAAKTRETTILQAWRKWYAEAVRSASRLAVGPVTPALTQKLDAIAAPFEARSGGVAPLQVGLGAGVGFAQQTIEPWRDLGKPMFTCGVDERLPSAIPLRWDTVTLVGDGRVYVPCPPPPGVPKLPHPADHREIRESVVLTDAHHSTDAETRRLYVQAIGRIEDPSAVGSVTTRVAVTPACYRQALVFSTSERWQPFTLTEILANDADPRVRREAANAIGNVLAPNRGDYYTGTQPDPFQMIGARVELESCYARESNVEVAATILETLGRLPYADDAAVSEAEQFLTAQIDLLMAQPARSSVRLLGAAKGIELLLRQHQNHPVAPPTRQQLRNLAFVGNTGSPVPTLAGPGTAPVTGDDENYARIRRLALLALLSAKDDDGPTLERAARDADWQVRRLVASRLDLGREDMARIAEQLETDQAFQVRYELLSPLGRAATRTRTCAPLLHFLNDRAPAVVLRAIDLIPAGCTDLNDAMKTLIGWADLLGRPDAADEWHVPSRALNALARVNPEEARPRLRVALAHPAWQVRVAAATVARTLGNQNLLVALAASDPHPNVRTAALEELTRIKSQVVFQPAIAALTSPDHQLLRASALALKGAPEALHDEASTGLLQALDRLTPPEGPADTSRDPRVAMIERLGEVLPPERAGELRRYLADVDPAVRNAAVKSFEVRTGAAGSSQDPWKRYPFQPSESTMTSLPKTAEIRMDGGALIAMELYVDQAPVTIARFADLVRAGYYNGLTFHRVVPNFVIQGGSPGANEYVGVTRYMRDELGTAPHVRGAVGISTRGRDTGDAQIFIDLVDVPRLDHDYTVFGRVVSGLDVVDKVLEGAKITSVTVK